MFFYVEWFPVKHAAPRFPVTKYVTKKKKKKRKRKDKEKERAVPGWTDISGQCPASFLYRSSMYHSMLILRNPIKLLNVSSMNSFSWIHAFCK